MNPMIKILNIVALLIIPLTVSIHKPAPISIMPQPVPTSSPHGSLVVPMPGGDSSRQGNPAGMPAPRTVP
jgi:hypothetical protein